jgi:Transposase DDE domain group 1
MTITASGPQPSMITPSQSDGTRSRSRASSRLIVRSMVKRPRAAWPTVKIAVRGDRGFCRWRLMRWCDSQRIGYALELAKHPALERERRFCPLGPVARMDDHVSG